MMTKRDWKKQLKRVRDIADKNFSRGDKPEQLDESLTKLEQRIENIKHVCQAVGKKLVACLQLHGVDSEKRSRKLPDSLLSKQFHESSVAFEDRDAFRKALSLCSKVEEQLANHKIFYENNIEKNVLEPLQEVIEKDIPVIVKSRKLVLKQAQEVEALKSRHSTVTRQSLQPLESARKLTQAQEDMEEAVNKLELYKDQLATEMYNFHAKEADLNRIFIRLIELQLNYHADATTSLQNILPNMKSTAEECFRQPVFGVSLEDHLRHTKQPIASVLNECITALKSEGLELEGLFRVAGGATKLKKLRAAFDAGMVDLEEYMVDPHCVASALKLYLRELPEPLMTYELYNDWAEAAHCSGEQRISAITNTLKKMRKPHFDNLKFLMQFLSKLADFSEVNKMSASNLAIVVGPNLLWSKTGDGQKILATGVQSAIAETMITNSVQFFGEDPEFGTVQSETVSLATPNSTPGRDVNKLGNVKQTTRKVDSSDSLSSDSLGADSYTTATNASSFSSSDISTATRNVDISLPTRNVDVDLTCLVTPKRTAKKTAAPLPPANESTMTFVIPANVADMRTAPVSSEECTKTGRSDKTKPGGHTEPGNPVLPHAAEANVATLQRKASVETKMILATVSGAKSGTIQRKLLNVTEGHFDSGRKENAVEVKTKGEPNAKKTTRSAVGQAFVSNLLSSGTQRTPLTQPIAACPEQKMSKPMNATGVQNEAESLPNSLANQIVFNPDARAMTMTRMGKGAAKPSTTGAASDQLPPGDFRIRHEEENKNIVIQKFKEEVPLKNQPERMMKRFQSMPSEGETQNVFSQDSDSKAASEATGHVAEKNEPRFLSSQKPIQLSGAGVGTLQKGNMKHRLQEAPNSGHHQSIGPGSQVPEPDLHEQCTSELPSPRADGNDLL